MSERQYGLLEQYRAELDFSQWDIWIALGTVLGIQILTLALVIPEFGSAQDFREVAPSMVLLFAMFMLEPFWAAGLRIVVNRVMSR